MDKGISAMADAFSSVAPKSHTPSAKVLFTIYIEPAPVMFWSGGYRSPSYCKKVVPANANTFTTDIHTYLLDSVVLADKR